MKLCWFCPKCKCEKCIFHSIDDNGEESCYWGYIDEVRKWLKQPHAPQKQDDYPCNVKGCTMETRQSCCGCPDYFKWKEHHDS